MKQFRIKPTIQIFESCREFGDSFQIGAGDLLITSGHTYHTYLKEIDRGAVVIDLRKYGNGEPNNQMAESIYKDMKDISYNRVFAVGGGSILDVAKLFALENISPVIDLFDKKLPIKKSKELIMVPTTCGTGSEVTNISILELKEKNTKFGLAVDELFADYAVLIPELLKTLPYDSFAASSLDAFVHAIESYLSPKASSFSRMYSKMAMELLINGYRTIAEKGKDARTDIMEDFLFASTYAGIAFGNAGCAAVHALSYPLGSYFHVPHGESNYAMFHGVFSKYMALEPDGKIKELNKFLALQLGCEAGAVYRELELLFQVILPAKHLREYGVSKEHIQKFTESVMKNQSRLLANNYTELKKEDIEAIYLSVY